MKLMHLATLRDIGSASGHLHISCIDCAVTVPYADAVNQQWQYDVEGPRFQAFYCPPCAPFEFDIIDVMTGHNYYTFGGSRVAMLKWLQANGYTFASDVYVMGSNRWTVHVKKIRV